MKTRVVTVKPHPLPSLVQDNVFEEFFNIQIIDSASIVEDFLVTRIELEHLAREILGKNGLGAVISRKLEKPL